MQSLSLLSTVLVFPPHLCYRATHGPWIVHVQTEHVRKSQHVFHFALKLDPVGTHLQWQRPSVTELP